MNISNDCDLISGPWEWNGEQFVQMPLYQPSGGFFGYWVKVEDSCTVGALAVRSNWNASLYPPGPPTDSSSGFFTDFLKWLGVRLAPPVPPSNAAPLKLQEVHLIRVSGGRLELQIQGTDIVKSEVRLFDFSGHLVAEAHGSGSRLRVETVDRDGRPLANGVYLYVVTVRGADGQTTTAEPRKLLILR